MKLWDIIKTVGAGAIAATGPAGAAIISAVNAFLPVDEQLPDTATGDDIGSAVASIPPNQRAELLSREFDVQLTQIKESNETVRMMLDSDARNPQSTRPYIAKGAFHVVAAAVLLTVSLWAYAVVVGDSDMVETVMGGWPFILSVVGPLVVLLRAYFGILKQEHNGRLNAANGERTNIGILSTIMKGMK